MRNLRWRCGMSRRNSKYVSNGGIIPSCRSNKYSGGKKSKRAIIWNWFPTFSDQQSTRMSSNSHQTRSFAFGFGEIKTSERKNRGRENTTKGNDGVKKSASKKAGYGWAGSCSKAS